MSDAPVYRRVIPASPDELSELIKGQLAQPGWRLQETADLVDFDRVDETWLSGLPGGFWPFGRVFSSQSEIRWWAAEGGFGVLLLCDESIPALEGQSNWQLEFLETDPEEFPIYLWGERKPADPEAGRSADDPFWIETRIPRSLRYPLEHWDGLPFVTVMGRSYYQNGIVRLTRLVGLAASDGSQGG